MFFQFGSIVDKGFNLFFGVFNVNGRPGLKHDLLLVGFERLMKFPYFFVVVEVSRELGHGLFIVLFHRELLLELFDLFDGMSNAVMNCLVLFDDFRDLVDG